jgi:large subunit ribosomal protein L31e
LDTVEDKGVEEKATAEEEAPEEVEEAKEGVEEQPTEEESVEEELETEEAPEEEMATEAKKEEGEPEEAAEAEAEEEEAEEKEKRGKKPEEEEIVEERIYTIPLRRAWIAPRKKRTPRAMRIIRGFVQRHMKVETEVKGEEEEEGRLVISNEVNERLWSRGIEKPPRNIRVRAVKDKEGVVTLYLAEGD